MIIEDEGHASLDYKEIVQFDTSMNQVLSQRT